jgi:ABC-type transporter Mla MlaB component
VVRSNVVLEWRDDGALILPETVNVATVPDILKQVKQSATVCSIVDFSNVKQADSVALAMLLSWQTDLGKPIDIRSLPEVLLTLVDLYDLGDVLQSK